MENSPAESIVFSEKDPNFVKNKVKNIIRQGREKILKPLLILSIFCLLFIVIFIIIYELFFKNNFYVFQLTNQKEITRLQNEIIDNGGYHDFGIGLRGFRGQIQEIGKDYLVLKGGGDTVRVIISLNTSLAEFPWIIQGDIADRMHSKPEIIIKFESLRKGEFVDVIGKSDNNNNFEAFKVMVYRKWIK